MTEFKEKELIASALDVLKLALDALNDIDNIDFEIEAVIGKVENAKMLMTTSLGFMSNSLS